MVTVAIEQVKELHIFLGNSMIPLENVVALKWDGRLTPLATAEKWRLSSPN